MKSSFGARLARKIGWLSQPVEVNWPGGVASFTFDDFPKSALDVGGAILEKYGACGTYYTAMQFAGARNHFGPLFEIGDIVAAHRAGHEIACHTYSHLGCRRATGASIAAEIDRNSREIALALDGTAPTSFAYPYGSVSLTARRTLKRRFSSSRGTAEGINGGTTDLTDLRVITLFAHLFDQAALYRSIDEAHAGNGWVIFYTHDVTEEPSEWGCTPAQLEAVAAYVAGKLEVLPVGNVVARLPGGTAG
jgi:peptidoglycan/xylan/chitin deacetylase (PgdA/CDA1 family)